MSEAFKGAIVIKGQARVTAPGRVGAVLAEKAQVQGAEIVQTEVTKLTPAEEGGWQIATAQDTLTASHVVLAAGVWSADLLKPLGLPMPLVAERGYHVEFPTPAVELNNSVMDVDAKVVASSMLGGLRVAGTAEFGSADAPADPRKKQILSQQAKAMMPELDTGEARFWMGRRPSFPDSLPAIGQVKDQEGLYAAFGHSHYGLMMAPKTGELVADIVSDRIPNIDLAPYTPTRF